MVAAAFAVGMVTRSGGAGILRWGGVTPSGGDARLAGSPAAGCVAGRVERAFSGAGFEKGLCGYGVVVMPPCGGFAGDYRGLPGLVEVFIGRRILAVKKTACDAAAGSVFRGGWDGDCSVLLPRGRGESKSRRKVGGFCVRAVVGGLGRRGDCSMGGGLAMRELVSGASGIMRVGLAAGVGGVEEL